jgi:hypothetical protein
LDQELEQFQEDLHKTNQKPVKKLGHVAQTTAMQPVEAKSEFLIQVENFLAEDLGDIYNRMEQNQRQIFKLKGEEVARKIEEMAAKGKMRIKKIVALIKEWLKIIPGVNRFFLEQEAKIKGDKIIGMTSR